MLENNTFVQHMKQRLQEDSLNVQKYVTAFDNAKNYLCQNIYPSIVRREPNLTKHDETHVDAVMNKIAELLITDSTATPKFSSIELYILAMAALFHDVGNINGRKGHTRDPKIGEIYTNARGNAPEIRRERTVVLSILKSHGGKAIDGSRDTLQEVAETESFEGTIAARSIAAILRFADELAEGPDRTSEYLRNTGGYSAGSKVYHDYSSVTNITVDRGNSRVLLNYEIEISESCDESCKLDDCLCDKAVERCWNFLEFIYRRIIKLDQERRYARYYTDKLSYLNATEASFNFHWKEMLLDANTLQLVPIRLDEKIVPGDSPSIDIPSKYSEYERDNVMGSIKKRVEELEEI